MGRTLLLFLALAAGATSGCRRHVVVHEADGDVVVIERGHLHTAHCGHWLWRGRWYHRHGHVHAGGCGHVHRDGAWVLAD